MSKPYLLYVDDEEENLKVFNRVFKNEFHVFTALSGEQGLEIFEQNLHITLIVSDQRMPGMSGVDFLNACKLINPEPIRILLTGYADIESTIHAINESEIYRFIKKPWEKMDLLHTLLEAQKKYDLMQDIKKKNEDLLELDKLKDKFMMLVNHELKTPLTVQKSYLDLLKDSKLTEEQLLYLERSIGGSDRLENLISEILYFLKIQKENTFTKEEFKVEGFDVLSDVSLNTHKSYFLDALNRLSENAQQHKKENTEVLFTYKNSIFTIENQLDKAIDIDLIQKPFEINEEAFNHSKGLGLGLSIANLILSKLGFKTEITAQNGTFKISVFMSEHLAK